MTHQRIRHTASCVLLLGLLACGCGRGKATSELERAVTNMTALLKQDRVEEFLAAYVRPEVLARYKERPGRYDRFLRDFREKEQAGLLADLQHAASLEPQINEQRTMADFAGQALSRTRRFVRIEGRWYILL